jgi:hypothetical protein
MKNNELVVSEFEKNLQIDTAQCIAEEYIFSVLAGAYNEVHEESGDLPDFDSLAAQTQDNLQQIFRHTAFGDETDAEFLMGFLNSFWEEENNFRKLLDKYRVCYLFNGAVINKPQRTMFQLFRERVAL